MMKFRRTVARLTLPLVATAAIGGAALAGAATAAADNATSTSNGPSIGSSEFTQGATAVAPKTDSSKTQRVSDPNTGGPSVTVPTVGAPTTKDVLKRRPWEVPGLTDKHHATHWKIG